MIFDRKKPIILLADSKYKNPDTKYFPFSPNLNKLQKCDKYAMI